jgi:hypothetical protein
MRKHRLASWIAFLGIIGIVAAVRGTELGVEGEKFTVNGKSTFLLGCSYYGGLGAKEEAIRKDLDELHRMGFNWIRVWADWTAFGEDLSAVVGGTGEGREPYLAKLVRLCAECDRRGMIVDVTLTRGKGAQGKPLLAEPGAHRRAVETIARALGGAKNWYLDLSNERNIRDARYTSVAELAELREAARKINPTLLVTASHGGDASKEEVLAYLKVAHLDFVSIHRPRDAVSAGKAAEDTRRYRKWLAESGRVAPVMYDEPFRRGYGKWEPVAGDFLKDLKSSRESGAAGWCFHNGDTRGAKDREPRRGFDLREKGLLEQLDGEERKFLAAVEVDR